MFGWIKNPFSKKEDFSGIKDHVLGENLNLSRPNFEDTNSGRNSFDQNIDPALRPLADFRKKEQSSYDTYGNTYGSRNPNPYSGEGREESYGRRRLLTAEDDDGPSESARPFEKKLDVDKVVNTLLLIKEQLAAIKAQNEMINERLKNLERVAGAESY